MAKKNNIEEQSFELDVNAINEVAQTMDSIPVDNYEQAKRDRVKYRRTPVEDTSEEELVSCLRNEIIEVKFVPSQNCAITDKKNPFYGGKGENSITIISVPKQRNGSFVNVLTNAEKKYLEYIMGLEDNALSVYKRENNFWSNSTEGGISKVILNKRDNRLNLADPEDYIKYKILLACKDQIAPDMHTLQDKPKATYQFVLVSNNEVTSTAKIKFNYKKQAYIEYGKIENNYEIMKAVLELLSMKPQAKEVSLDYLQVEVSEFIEQDAKTFLNVVKDPLLPTKILIKKAVDAGLISKRTNYYYLRSTNEPLCEAGEEATLTIAAKFLMEPKNQEIRFNIEGRLNNKD